MLGQLLSIVKDETVPSEVSQLAFQLLYLITKVLSQLITQSSINNYFMVVVLTVHCGCAQFVVWVIMHGQWEKYAGQKSDFLQLWITSGLWN